MSDRAEHRRSQARVPEVLLSDYQLGEVTADKFLREVKARWPSIRCILHSASRRYRWTDLLKDGVLDAVLVKPRVGRGDPREHRARYALTR